MELLPYICVAFGGAIGSLLRYVAGVWLTKFATGSFPLPTFMINITGSFLMGVWIATMATLLPGKAKELHLLVALGVLGGYTTFSTFSLEAYMLIEKGLWGQAALYIGGSVALGIAALFAGLFLFRGAA